jgi:hypothetical protein
MHNTTELLQRQLHAYCDSWRFENGRDVPPWELEGWLEAGVSLFRLIRRLEEHLGGKDADVRGLYEDWLRNASGPMGKLNQIEAQGAFVADAGDFRDAEREARGVLHVPLDAVLGPSQHACAAGATVPDIGEGLGHSLPA